MKQRATVRHGMNTDRSYNAARGLRALSVPIWLLAVTALWHSACAEPIVITGRMLPSLLGTPVAHLRVFDTRGAPVVFQIDEVNADGEYICTHGSAPNDHKGNGRFDANDELVFLSQDCTVEHPCDTSAPQNCPDGIAVSSTAASAQNWRVYICAAPDAARSTKKYIDYDADKEIVSTPFYTAQFEKKRFHFVKAGLKMPEASSYDMWIDRLRIKIRVSLLWGLIPVTYDEQSIHCTVTRYKCGPIRLIRRGDFYLKLAPGVAQNRAAVNQICYPAIVRVPVYTRLPVRLGTFCSRAWIEMTPVISSSPGTLAFHIPGENIKFDIPFHRPVDTILRISPYETMWSIHNNRKGFGWVVRSSIDSSCPGDKSSFVFRSDHTRFDASHCGYRLQLNDLARGTYLITNWVVFSRQGPASLHTRTNALLSHCRLRAGTRIFTNKLNKIHGDISD